MTFKENGTKHVRHVWSVLCSSSILDADTQNLTINNVIEGIGVNIQKDLVEKKQAENTSGYAVPVPMHIVTKLIRKSPNQDISLELKYEEIDPSGRVLSSSAPQRIDFKKQYKNVRWRTSLPALLVTSSGDYAIRVLLKESDEQEYEEIDRVPFEVSLAEAAKVSFT